MLHVRFWRLPTFSARKRDESSMQAVTKCYLNGRMSLAYGKKLWASTYLVWKQDNRKPNFNARNWRVSSKLNSPDIPTMKCQNGRPKNRLISHKIHLFVEVACRRERHCYTTQATGGSKGLRRAYFSGLTDWSVSWWTERTADAERWVKADAKEGGAGLCAQSGQQPRCPIDYTHTCTHSKSI